jgi:nucleoside-diphosphate-sugar epimerase
MLGKSVVTELRQAGIRVRSLARRIPAYSQRVPGVEYVAADLGRSLDDALLTGVEVVVHCAAETVGGKSEHERNSVAATQNMLEAAARARVTRFVHISSLAVLKRVRGQLDEHTPVDSGTLDRGPYVWGKAQSEVLALRRGSELGLEVKILRPGPLVDYKRFSPPGRLGREIGPFYVAVGGRRSQLSVCDVSTAARVIRSYVQTFEHAPAVLNMVEGKPPTRRELVVRLRESRPDLTVIWFPGWLLRLMNGPLKLAQRLLLRSPNPIDVYGAFASERYRTDLALQVIERAGPSGARG